jgi:hypothetical protein
VHNVSYLVTVIKRAARAVGLRVVSVQYIIVCEPYIVIVIHRQSMRWVGEKGTKSSFGAAINKDTFIGSNIQFASRADRHCAENPRFAIADVVEDRVVGFMFVPVEPQNIVDFQYPDKTFLILHNRTHSIVKKTSSRRKCVKSETTF